MERLRKGDTGALHRLYEKYRTDLFSVALSLVRDAHSAEDCLQDVFVKLAERVNRLVISRNLKGYLVSSVANCARDKLRRKSVPVDSAEGAPQSADLPDPASELIGREESARIFNALGQLPYPQREVFVLRVQSGLKFREIARLQDVSVKTVLSRYRYGIDRLREILEKDNGHEV